MPRLTDENETINHNEIEAMLTIWEPRNYPLIRGGKATIGQCIDEIIKDRRPSKLELNLDRRDF